MARIPHEFEDEELLRLALTHASLGEEQSNERLEFLGDAVLDLVIAHELYERYPRFPEGQLTELKAWIVSRRTLADAARAMGLDERADVGSGMRHRALPPSVLANLYEAVLGAVYLDGGYAPAREFALATLAETLAQCRASSEGANPKQVLQQHCQIRTGSPPEYQLLEERGRAHARAFLVAAEVEGERYPSAWGRTRKEAERWAAHEALLAIEDAGDAGPA